MCENFMAANTAAGGMFDSTSSRVRVAASFLSFYNNTLSPFSIAKSSFSPDPGMPKLILNNLKLFPVVKYFLQNLTL